MNEMIIVATNGIWVRMMMKTKAGSSGNRRVQPFLSSQRSLKGGLGSFFLAALASALSVEGRRRCGGHMRHASLSGVR